jgi:hypothetical protein
MALLTNFGHHRTHRSGLQYAGANRRVIIGRPDHRVLGPGFSRAEVFAMIYELRVYQPVPGQMPKLLTRFRDKPLPILEKARHPSHRLLDDPRRGIQQRANVHTPMGVELQ